jgi:DNA-binding MarR family transcriptional regulator
MITAEPDVTRLLDRLEGRKLIVRERSKTDRRIVLTRITQQGLDLLTAIQQPAEKLLRRNLGHLGQQKLADLIATLESLREPQP